MSFPVFGRVTIFLRAAVHDLAEGRIAALPFEP